MWREFVLKQLCHIAFLMVCIEFEMLVFIIAAAFFIFLFHATFAACSIFFLKETPTYKLIHAKVQMHRGTHSGNAINRQ